MLRLTSLQRTGFLRVTPRVDLVAAVGLLLLSVALAVSKDAPEKGVTLTVVAVACSGARAPLWEHLRA